MTQIRATDKQNQALLERNIEATDTTVIGGYEEKIPNSEKPKRHLQENIANRSTPKGSFDDVLESAM